MIQIDQKEFSFFKKSKTRFHKKSKSKTLTKDDIKRFFFFDENRIKKGKKIKKKNERKNHIPTTKPEGNQAIRNEMKSVVFLILIVLDVKLLFSFFFFCLLFC